MDLCVRVCWWRRPFEQLVVEPLVVSLAMVVLDVLVNYQVQVAFTQQDDSAETLFLDGPHEPFRVGVQIRASGWQLDRLDTAALENLGESTGVERISVVNQVPRSSEKAVDRVGCE